jgi:endonuclease G
MFKSFSAKLAGGFLLSSALIALSTTFFTAKKTTAYGVHLTMGNPSGATTSTSNSNNYLMEKSQYALSYNNSKRIANWVSWQLNSSWLGNTLRQDDFRADKTLPSGWYPVTSSEYSVSGSVSGFDRGHMTPSADRTDTDTNNSATFLMTNIVPQAPDNNQGYWARLEDYQRTLVGQGKELFIIAGSYGQGGSGSNGSKTSIGNGVTVPARLWKIIVVTTPGTGVGGVNTSTRVIAIDTPNTQGNRSTSWGNYRTTVDAIESNTGYNFLSNVNSGTQSVIESRVDSGPTQ